MPRAAAAGMVAFPFARLGGDGAAAAAAAAALPFARLGGEGPAAVAAAAAPDAPRLPPPPSAWSPPMLLLRSWQAPP